MLGTTRNPYKDSHSIICSNMWASMNRGPQNRPKYIRVLIIGATKMGPLIFANSHIPQNDTGNHVPYSTGATGPPFHRPSKLLKPRGLRVRFGILVTMSEPFLLKPQARIMSFRSLNLQARSLKMFPMLWRCRGLPISWSHFLDISIVPYTSNVPQNDICHYPGPYIRSQPSEPKPQTPRTP